MGGMLVYSHSDSHFWAFVQASDPLQGVMTYGLYYKESGHPDYVASVPKCAVQMKLQAGHGDNRGTSSIGISALNQFQFMFFLFMMFNFIFVFLNPTKFDHAGIGMETYSPFPCIHVTSASSRTSNEPLTGVIVLYCTTLHCTVLYIVFYCVRAGKSVVLKTRMGPPCHPSVVQI